MGFVLYCYKNLSTPIVRGDSVKIQESAENYLETILILSERSTYVRSIDIANELNFTKPSVSVAMKSCARTI